jgi:hypothetical protein
MIKLTLGVSRRADWSRQDWLTHYAERHGPLVAGLKIFGSHTLKYVQNYAQTPDESSPIASHASWIDGVSELWYRDVEALKSAYEDPGYMSLIRPDELSFCDLNSILGGVGREYPIVIEPVDDDDKTWVHKDRSRLLVYRKAAPEHSDASLQAAWLESAGTISQDSSFRRYVSAYVQTHIQNDESPLPSSCPFGVIDEFWFRSNADAIAWWQETRVAEPIRELEQRVTSAAEMLICLVRSHSVFEDA